MKQTLLILLLLAASSNLIFSAEQAPLSPRGIEFLATAKENFLGKTCPIHGPEKKIIAVQLKKTTSGGYYPWLTCVPVDPIDGLSDSLSGIHVTSQE